MKQIESKMDFGEEIQLSPSSDSRELCSESAKRVPAWKQDSKFDFYFYLLL